MAAGRPILAVAPAGAALFDLLGESGAGVCIERDDEAGIEHALEEFLHNHTPPRARVERYRWSNLALQYRDVIEVAAGANLASVMTPAGERDTSSHTAPAGRSA